MIGSKSDGNLYVREIGNVISLKNEGELRSGRVSKREPRYFFFYSASNNKDRRGVPNEEIRVHKVSSIDGKNWINEGPVTSFPAEDPYVTLDRELTKKCIMLFEDKSVFPDYYVSMAESGPGCETFEFKIRALVAPKANFELNDKYVDDLLNGKTHWNIKSTSSPVIRKNGTNYEVLVEAIGTDLNRPFVISTGIVQFNSEFEAQTTLRKFEEINGLPEGTESQFVSDYIKFHNYELIITQAIKYNNYWVFGLAYKKQGEGWKMNLKPLFWNGGSTGVMFFHDVALNCLLFVKGSVNHEGNKISMYRPTNFPKELDKFLCKN